MNRREAKTDGKRIFQGKEIGEHSIGGLEQAK